MAWARARATARKMNIAMADTRGIARTMARLFWLAGGVPIRRILPRVGQHGLVGTVSHRTEKLAVLLRPLIPSSSPGKNNTHYYGWAQLLPL
jgi:hypothetical protein